MFGYVSWCLDRLPKGTRWSFSATEDTAGVLNILVTSDGAAADIQRRLDLQIREAQGLYFETFRTGNPILVSLVRPEFYINDPQSERMGA
jgi:hypothetical protein